MDDNPPGREASQGAARRDAPVAAMVEGCPGLSAKVLNERLRKLIRFKIVNRSVYGDKPPVEVEYRLTAFGRRFIAILDEIRRLQDAVDRGEV